MSKNVVIEKHLDENYAIARAYTILNKQGPAHIYSSSAECHANSDRTGPASAGFVVLDKRIPDWNKSISDWFFTYDEAKQCYDGMIRDREESKAADSAADISYVEESEAADSEADMSCGREEIASMALGENTIRVLKSTSSGADSANISVVLTLPNGETQDLVCVAASGQKNEAEVLLWEDENDEAFTDSRNISFRDVDNEKDGEDSTRASITEFCHEYMFLNNAYRCPVYAWGLEFQNAEAAFQSMKCSSDADRLQFCGLSAKEAKASGRRIPLRSDWDQVKDLIMYEIITAKFTQTPSLTQALLDTGDAYICPQNMRHDNYWGTCQCASCANKEKENKLGIILMQVRSKLRS